MSPEMLSDAVMLCICLAVSWQITSVFFPPSEEEEE